MSSSERRDPNIVVAQIVDPPDGNSVDRPASNAFGCGCLTLMVTALAILPCCGGMYWSQAAKRDLGEITLAQAQSRTATPSGSFVIVRGTPDPAHVAEIIGSGDNVGTVMLTFREAPRLVLVCRKDHPLAIATQETSPRKAIQNLSKEWKLEGRLINGGDFMPEIPDSRIREFVREDLGLKNVSDARVIVVGETSQKWITKAYWGYGFATALAVLALVGWVTTFRTWMTNRERS